MTVVRPIVVADHKINSSNNGKAGVGAWGWEKMKVMKRGKGCKSKSSLAWQKKELIVSQVNVIHLPL